MFVAMLQGSHLSAIFNSELVSRLLVVVFSILTVFFIYSPYTATSFYSQVFSSLNIYGSRAMYETVRVAVYAGSLVCGVVLIAFFVRNGRSLRRVEGLVAVNCALQGFVAQSTASLGYQRSLWEVQPVVSGSAWAIESLFILVLFVATWLLLIAAFLLLTHHWLGRTVGRFASVISFVGNVIVLVIGLNLPYGSVSVGNMLGVPVIMLVTSVMSIYYLYKSIPVAEATKEEKNAIDEKDEIADEKELMKALG